MDDELDIARLVLEEDYRLQCRRRMQTDLFWLAKYILGYTLLSEKYHREPAEVFVHKDDTKPIREQSPVIKRRMLILPRRTYKALALDTKIPTPDGFTTMGAIEVGDTVFSDKGKPCKVLGCSPVYESRDCYSVEFSTSETVIADAGHLWVTDSRRDRDNVKHKGIKFCPRIRTTEEIAQTVMLRDERNHRVCLAAPLDLPVDNDLPIDPYVLGCWLGNGASDGRSITIPEPEFAEEILKTGEIIRPTPYPSDPLKWVFNGGPDHDDYDSREFSFSARIRELGLYKNKHIPMAYLRASELQRWALLQGLMDTDGNAAKRDGQLTFSNTNLRLVEEFKELVASLGMKPRVNGPYAAKIDGQIVGCFYHVAFMAYSDQRIFRVSRKQALLRERGKFSLQNFRHITAVEQIDPVPVRCIMVDSPSQQYLVTDSFIPTHNTTLNIADTVQWVLNFPDVAIMVLVAGNSPDSPLADAFVAEVASHFFCPKDGPRKPLQICFPEHRIFKFPAAGTFTTPARKKFRRDPTVKGVSIEQSLSGWHPDILKSEDVQDNRNSQTVYALKKVRKNFYLNLKMLGEGGLLDLTCTRYGPADLYGDMIAKAGPESIILWKPAYVRKPHAIGFEEDELTEDDVILQFPEQLSWEFLMSEKRLDPETFYTQYLNIAEGNFVPTFPIDRLEAAKIPSLENDARASTSKFHIAWRFEVADSKYQACAVGIERDGRMTVMDLWRGQATPTNLAARVVSTAKFWETHRVMIEDTPGAQSTLQHIQNQALEQGWRVEILWMEHPRDPVARTLAIKAAEPHLLAGRLLFDDSIRMLSEGQRQLYHFGMIEDTDIATVVARLAAQLPQSIAAHNFNVNDEQAFNDFIARDAYDRTYNRGRYYHDQQQPVEIEEEYAAPNEDNDYMPGLTG